MFERFTDRARRVVVLAQEEARLLNHNYIGTEHVLLGLVHEGEGVGAKALEELGISLGRARDEVLKIIGHGGSAPVGHIPFTPRAKKVLELSLREALERGHNYIGTEHILLGLIREGEGVGAQVLVKLGADLSTVRTNVIQLLSGYAGGQPPAPGPTIHFASGDAPAASVLLRRGPHEATCAFCGRDVWELDRYVAGHDVVICDVCVDAAQRVIASAADSEDRGLAMPPRVFGQPPDSRAVEEIASAVEAVFGHRDPAECARALEDGERLAPLRAEAELRFPMYSHPSARLDRVRFELADRARLRISVVAQGQTTQLAIEGEAVRRDRWLITRETFCQVMQMAHVTCPPPEEPDG